MTIILNLPPNTEERLRRIAADAGLTPEKYLLSLLEQPGILPGLLPEDDVEEDDVFSPAEREAFENEPVPTTPAEILKYWDRVGVHESAPGGPDSPELARQWREDEEKRMRRRLFGKI